MPRGRAITSASARPTRRMTSTAVTKSSGLPGNPIILEAENPAKPPILRYSGRAAPHGGGAIQIYGSEYLDGTKPRLRRQRHRPERFGSVGHARAGGHAQPARDSNPRQCIQGLGRFGSLECIARSARRADHQRRLGAAVGIAAARRHGDPRQPL